MTGIRLRARVDGRSLDLDFDVAPGEVVAVLGPNGAGKSTVLHVIAGLLRPDEGSVHVGDRVLTDTSSGIDVATHDRRVGLLLQNALLFPHLDVNANVAFGPRSGKRLGRSASRELARRWLVEVEAGGLADRMPRQLSGGQAQRVALARALAAEPDVLLLDEPMAGLDVAAATAMRQVLRRVLARGGRSVVLVTHDLLDVVTLADRVVVIEFGRIVEQGPVATVLAAPRSRFGARFAGVNLVTGRFADDTTLVTDWGTAWHGTAASEGSQASQASSVSEVGRHALAVFPPSAVAVYRHRPDGSPRNAVEVEVAELDVQGPAVRIRTVAQPDGAPGLAADVTSESAADLRLTPGDRVYFVVKAQEVVLHAAP